MTECAHTCTEQQLDHKLDPLWLSWSSPVFTYTFWYPAPTTLSNLNLSFGSSYGTPRLTIPTFWVTFLVGLESTNFSVFAPFARTLLSVFVQANCLSSGHGELILWSYCRIHLPQEHCRMSWKACIVIHYSCPLSQHFWLIQWQNMVFLVFSSPLLIPSKLFQVSQISKDACRLDGEYLLSSLLA